MMRLFSALCLCLSTWLVSASDLPTTPQAKLPTLVSQLTQTKLKGMPTLISQVAETHEPQVVPLLESLLAGDLYYVKATKQVITATKAEDKKYAISDILTAETLGLVKKKTLKKIKTNNRLRGQIRSLLAQIALTDPDKGVRIKAVKQLLDKPNKSALASVESLIVKETDDDVKELMQVSLWVNTLTNGTQAEQIAVTGYLAESLEPAVNNAMVKLLDELPPGEESRQLRTALTSAISKIEQKKDIFSVLENVFFGLSLGSVLLLAAIGLAITFGVMGVINMAHGEMMMLGAYTTYVIQLAFPQLIEYSLLMAIPAAFLVSGLVGVGIERGVIRHLKGRPLETLLATFGISLILQQLVRTIFSPLNRQVLAPEWMSGSWQINPVFSLTFNRLYIIIFSLMVFFSLLMILKKTSLGLHVRAVSQNRDMARALSIKSDWVDAITFGLGSGIAGVAGVVLSQLTNVGPNLGQAYIIDSFLVVVFGGVGNLWGTLVAAMSLGSINKFLEPVTGSVLANIIVLVGLVLFIQKRPKGLFPQKGRSAD